MVRLGVDGGKDQQGVPLSQLRRALISAAELVMALRWVPPNGVRYTLPQVLQLPPVDSAGVDMQGLSLIYSQGPPPPKRPINHGKTEKTLKPR